jgi:hypothetical protein
MDLRVEIWVQMSSSFFEHEHHGLEHANIISVSQGAPVNKFPDTLAVSQKKPS